MPTGRSGRKIWAAFLEISALLDSKKDLPDLASVQASMTQAFGLLGLMCSSLNALNYYKRVTFFICSHAWSLPEFQIISGIHARDQEGLA